ncbi:AAA family ATPase [Mongoliitalea lutea]|uniref:ATPase AAA-type core domain-containing protein n=1 Tax=Mongoliitalea lutea TaxID=849756 RepID=A0A8J3D3N1_9BACT|nr:AAA family ATPase [Mongoliitalea lutea]GHB52910.1 hypothetical protein GCM10008106_36870 [Mongoliitalea lutea]
MKISKVSIKNFKRFDDLTIDLGKNPSRIIALVGPNGCGKSSVLDSFLMYNAQHYGNIGSNSGNVQDFKKNKSIHLSPGQSIGIELEGGIELASSGEFERRQQDGEGNTIFSFRSPYRYSSLLLKSTLEQVSDIKENQDGASFSNQLDDKISQNYSRLYVHFQNILKKENLRYEEAKSRVIGELNTSLEKCLDIKITDIGDIMDGKGTLFFSKQNDPNDFDYNKLSTGEKECVDMLIDIYLRKEVYKETIYCIDEPELHLNTGIQRKLLKEIIKMIPDKSQLWICTHSIGFLRALQLDYKDDCQILDFGTKDYFNGAKTIQPLSKTRKNWANIFETALEDLTGLIAPKTIIYCEGHPKPGLGNREKGFDAQIFNIIFEEKYPDVLFVSSGGNTELEKHSALALSVLNKAFLDVEILILKDKDINPSGESTSDKERNVFLRKSKSNRMLERREIENYLFDSEVLKKYCDKHNSIFDEEKYHVIVKDILEQDVKSKFQEIKSCCTQENIGKEVFCKELASLIYSDMVIYGSLEKVILSDHVKVKD